jgi:hypothetical protein
MCDREEHIYLYAKYWYKSTEDKVKDLQTIIKNCEGMELSRMEVIGIVYNMALNHIINKEHMITNFISDIAPENSWKVGYDCESIEDFKYDFWTAVLYKSLSILRLQSISDIDVKLGDPKSEIFESTTKKLRRYQNSIKN